jgi:hypothetical protein
MEDSYTIAEVIRVIRYDTLQLRTLLPQVQSKLTVYMTPCGVWCDEPAKTAACDWCELHADAGRLKLLTFDWMRDDYGRLLGDLADIQTGETLTDYLVEVGAAKPRPHHYMDVLYALLGSAEVDEC